MMVRQVAEKQDIAPDAWPIAKQIIDLLVPLGIGMRMRILRTVFVFFGGSSQSMPYLTGEDDS